MTLEELARLVNDMRQAQREYFRTRSNSSLTAAKSLESKTDEAVASILTSNRQKTLFQ